MASQSDETAPKPSSVGTDLNPSGPRSFAKSASRALDVLCYMAQRQKPARAREVAYELDIAPSSADQLLKTLVASGHLVFRFTDKSYFPAPRLGQFARWLTKVYPDEMQVDDLLQELHLATGQVVNFSVETDCFMEVQSCILGDVTPRPGWSLHPGWRVPILESAIGGAVLASRSNAEIRRLFERARRLRPVTDPAVAERMVSTMHAVNEFRRLGYAWRLRSHGQRQGPAPEGDVMSVAIRLKSTELGTAMVLGLAGLERDVRPERDDLARTMQDLAVKYGLAA